MFIFNYKSDPPYLSHQMKGTATPVVVLGYFNDGTLSNTLGDTGFTGGEESS